jgi:exosome complex exonuclease RRP6
VRLPLTRSIRDDQVLNIRHRYVLPDHSLLRLVERPPSDMASLSSLFRPIPPVVRRRAQELLRIIKGASGAGISTVTNEDVLNVDVDATTVPTTISIAQDPMPSQDGDKSSLWSNGKSHIIAFLIQWPLVDLLS